MSRTIINSLNQTYVYNINMDRNSCFSKSSRCTNVLLFASFISDIESAEDTENEAINVPADLSQIGGFVRWRDNTGVRFS